MPCDDLTRIGLCGQRCAVCNGLATHEYAPGYFLCCQCHTRSEEGAYNRLETVQTHLTALATAVRTMRSLQERYMRAPGGTGLWVRLRDEMHQAEKGVDAAVKRLLPRPERTVPEEEAAE